MAKRPYRTKNELQQISQHRHFDISTLNLEETELLPISTFLVRVYSHEVEPVHFHVLSLEEGFDISFLTDGTIHEIIDSGNRRNDVASFADIEQRAKLWLQKPAASRSISALKNKENIEITWESNNADLDWMNELTTKVAFIGKVNPNVGYEEWLEKLETNINIEALDITHFNMPLSNGTLCQYVRRYASEHDIVVMEHTADFKTNGDDAMKLRNIAIVESSDHIVGFLPKDSSKESWIFRPGISKERNVIVIEC